jgi:hypothetical protein
MPLRDRVLRRPIVWKLQQKWQKYVYPLSLDMSGGILRA